MVACAFGFVAATVMGAFRPIVISTLASDR
jgi:hypothetical protein